MLGFISEKLLNSMLAEIRSGYERTLNAIRIHNTDLKYELENERCAHGETRQLLQRALRLEPRVEAQAGPARPHMEPIGRTKSWPKLQQELEEKFRRKPEDEAAKYWADKNAQLQTENNELNKTLDELEKQ